MTQQALIDDQRIIGFTGRRDGMSPEQRVTVVTLMIASMSGGTRYAGLHGDAIGADAEFFEISKG